MREQKIKLTQIKDIVINGDNIAAGMSIHRLHLNGAFTQCAVVADQICRLTFVMSTVTLVTSVLVFLFDQGSPALYATSFFSILLLVFSSATYAALHKRQRTHLPIYSPERSSSLHSFSRLHLGHPPPYDSVSIEMPIHCDPPPPYETVTATTDIQISEGTSSSPPCYTDAIRLFPPPSYV